MTTPGIIIRDEGLRDRAVSLIRMLDLSKGPWVLTVERQKKRRSLSQNALYWLKVEAIAQSTGDDKMALHETFKDMFCPTKRLTALGEERLVRSTKLLSTAEMAEYTTAVDALAASFGILTPAPEDMHAA